jgi:transposase InsO family protein
MCDVLAVSKAGYYAWRSREASDHARRDAELLVEVRKVHRKSRGTYGSPRIHAELKAKGVKVSRKRVARIMRDDGLRAFTKRRYRVTTDSKHREPVAQNVLARRFSVKDAVATNRVWVGDITYVGTHEGYLYLAVVLDLRSRRIVGWAMRYTLDSELVIAAFTAAMRDRRPEAGMLFHSDQGKQYASEEFRLLLRRYGITASMSRKGDCWDNAVAESFFRSLKTELVDQHSWKTREAARAAIFEYIESWYNRERRHSTLGYQPPAQFERLEGARVA